MLQNLSKFSNKSNFSFLQLCIVVLTIASVILMQVAARVHWNCMDTVSTPNCDMFCQQSGYKGPVTTCFMMTAILPALVNALLVVFWERVYFKIATRLTIMGKKVQENLNMQNYANLFIQKIIKLKPIMMIRWL